MKTLQRILFLLIFSTAALAAENTAEIVYAEGDLFTIVSSQGQRVIYEPSVDDVFGITLQIGDSIFTESNTWLELRLNNSGSLIKIADNTTFKLSALNEGGGGVLDLVYGRIRGKINKLAQGQELWVSGYDTVAGIRGTDFGYELFFDSQDEYSQQISTIYCFEGEVEIQQQKNDPQTLEGNNKRPEMKESIVLYGGEQVITLSGSPGDPLVKGDVAQGLHEFWMEHDFVLSPTEVTYDIENIYVEEELPAEEITLQDDPEDLSADIDIPLIIVEEETHTMPQPEEINPEMATLRKNVQTAGGISMSIGMGFATAGFITYMINPDENRDMLEVFGGMGGLFMATGSVLSLYSLTLDF